MVRLALRAGPASAPGFARLARQLGQVRKNWPTPGWLVRFQFKVDGKSSVFHGPVRAGRDEAEADRRAVVASIAQAPRSSRADIASRALQSLKDGSALSCSDEPGTASSFPAPDVKILRKMNTKQLRDVANRTVVPTRQEELERQMGAKD